MIHSIKKAPYAWIIFAYIQLTNFNNEIKFYASQAYTRDDKSSSTKFVEQTCVYSTCLSTLSLAAVCSHDIHLFIKVTAGNHWSGRYIQKEKYATSFIDKKIGAIARMEKVYSWEICIELRKLEEPQKVCQPQETFRLLNFVNCHNLWARLRCSPKLSWTFRILINMDGATETKLTTLLFYQRHLNSSNVIRITRVVQLRTVNRFIWHFATGMLNSIIRVQNVTSREVWCIIFTLSFHYHLGIYSVLFKNSTKFIDNIITSVEQVRSCLQYKICAHKTPPNLWHAKSGRSHRRSCESHVPDKFFLLHA